MTIFSSENPLHRESVELHVLQMRKRHRKPKEATRYMLFLVFYDPITSGSLLDLLLCPTVRLLPSESASPVVSLATCVYSSLLFMRLRHFGGKVSRGSRQTRSKTDLRPRQFYAPVVPDASSRGRMINGEITSFKSTHNTYSLIHVLFIDVDLFLLFKCKCYFKIV